MITNSKMADKNVSHFIILVSYWGPKYIGNMIVVRSATDNGDDATVEAY
jgi:hypothetical protein